MLFLQKGFCIVIHAFGKSTQPLRCWSFDSFGVFLFCGMPSRGPYGEKLNRYRTGVYELAPSDVIVLIFGWARRDGYTKPKPG